MGDTEKATWAERLSFLSNEDMHRLTEALRQEILEACESSPTYVRHQQTYDATALAEWRDRHPESKKWKAKRIRQTEEYQEISQRLREADRAKEEEERVIDEVTHQRASNARDFDELVGVALSSSLDENFLYCTSFMDLTYDLIVPHLDDAEGGISIDDIADKLDKEIVEILTSDDLENYAYEDDYEKPYWWHAKRHARISDVDDLCRWLREPEWGERRYAPIISEILRDDEIVDNRVVEILTERVPKTDIGGMLEDLTEELFGEWEFTDAYADWQSEITYAVYGLIDDAFPYERTLSLVRQNPRYADMFEELARREAREREMVESIVRLMPENPIDLYPLARSMERHFVLHVGPTNSGKTHDAIGILGRAPSGAYLAPLRLLAYEQCERLNDSGCPCSLLTGEEEMDVAGARHVASTIEMLDYSSPIDVAVIDEAQMMGDRDRGSHWTETILGVPAREVHVCLAPEAEGIVRQVIEACGDTWEVTRHERMTPLEQETGSFSFPKDVRKGDAVIVFTRRAVHAVAAMLASEGHTTSMVYGALPYDVRHREAERFASGETDVVVATDAIGMGMNLPIKRVVFLEQAKFDGRDKRFLTGIEIRQIAGRAGRYGIHESGSWTSANENKKMGRLMSADPMPISKAPIGFVRTLLGVDGMVSELMGKWSSLDTTPPFSKMDLERETALAVDLEGRLSADEALDADMKRLVYRFATMPFKENIEWLHDEWLRMFDCEADGTPFPVEVPSGELPRSMDALEAQYAHMDLLHQYCRAFGYTQHYEEIDARRRLISDRISELIARSVFDSKRCRECGRPLPWNWPYPMCDPCHERLYPRRRWYDDEW